MPPRSSIKQKKMDCLNRQRQCHNGRRQCRMKSNAIFRTDMIQNRSSHKKRSRCAGVRTNLLSKCVYRLPPKRRRLRSVTKAVDNQLSSAVAKSRVLCSSEFIAEQSSTGDRCYSDQADSDSNSCIEDLKTAVEEVASVQQEDPVVVILGGPAPQGNINVLDCGNNDVHVSPIRGQAFAEAQNSTGDSSFTIDSNSSNQKEIIHTPFNSTQFNCDARSHMPTSSISSKAVSGQHCPTKPYPSSGEGSHLPVPKRNENISSDSNLTKTSTFKGKLSTKAIPKREELQTSNFRKTNVQQTDQSRPLSNGFSKATVELNESTELQPRIYPLRSRIKQEQLRKQWEAMQNAPRTLNVLPVELILRIVQYLGIQDLFRVQRVNKRFRSVALQYLQQVKRVNFSNGLPFAFLPYHIDDNALKRILSCTPEVTHILGFYPRRMYGNYARITIPRGESTPRLLTYSGVIDVFRSCSKLRSVELMDVELMSQLVLRLPHVKFHGMFRNRPDSWDSEYAVPMPSEPRIDSLEEEVGVGELKMVPSSDRRLSMSPYYSCVNSLFSKMRLSGVAPTTNAELAQSAAAFAHQAAVCGARLAHWFEPIIEAPLGQGSPAFANYPNFGPSSSHRLLIGPNPPPPAQPIPVPQETGPAHFADTGAMVALAIAAAFVQPENALRRLRLGNLQDRMESAVREGLLDVGWLHPPRRGRGGAQPRSGPTIAPRVLPTPLPMTPTLQQVQVEHYVQNLVTPLPMLLKPLPVTLPHVVSNLTKLDLVSVAISALPKLDNVKYLHLKWVIFTMSDPFGSFQANKLQSFIMNNCIGPHRFVRLVRIFAVLARAPQLMRLELVGTRFIGGLIEHLIDREEPPAYGFRNLQRLVLAGNRDATEIDVGLLLVASQQSLSHLALQIWHTRTSLFDSLSCAGVRLLRLESLVLGYQDPYRSRLTASELGSLELVDSLESLMPVCNFTNRGLTLVFSICPRLNSLTLRHAPFITHFPTAVHEQSASDTAAEVVAPASVEDRGGLNDSEADPRGGLHTTCLPLRSLTLENCPNIDVKELERIISTGNPFKILDSLILRDMLLPRRETSFASSKSLDLGASNSWSRRWLSPDAVESGEAKAAPQHNRNWKKLGLLLSIADHLSSHRLAFTPLAPTGVGLGSSVREVTHVAFVGMTQAEMVMRPFDAFFAMRTHSYLTSLLHLDGTCGPSAVSNGRIWPLLLDDGEIHHQPTSVTPAVATPSPGRRIDFVSQSSQTCVCGLLEWDFIQRLQLAPVKPISPFKATAESGTSARTLPAYPYDCVLSQRQLGGPLAFHPFPPSLQHTSLYSQLVDSEWSQQVEATPLFNHLQKTPLPFVRPLGGSGECPGCASGAEPSPSLPRAEMEIGHTPRMWTARDACVDTGELRCHTGPSPCVMTLSQPVNAPFSCLTTLHFEKVGISHLVLSSVPRLKSITLENCSILRGIIVHPLGATGSCAAVDPVPCLRRVRVLRCPKFAIYHWLHTVAKLYPQHDENISITFRPFGQYNVGVERALWGSISAAHLLISHDYSRSKSERDLEDFQSRIDQRFREVMHCPDPLYHLEGPPRVVCLHGENPRPFFCEDIGMDWDIACNLPWMREYITLERPSSGEPMPGAPSGPTALRSHAHAHQPQTPTTTPRVCEVCFFDGCPNALKLYRRGVHLHVQYRDVHMESVGDEEARPVRASASLGPTLSLPSYLKWPYTDRYIATVDPADDLNVWGDGLDESLTAVLPPRCPDNFLDCEDRELVVCVPPGASRKRQSNDFVFTYCGDAKRPRTIL